MGLGWKATEQINIRLTTEQKKRFIKTAKGRGFNCFGAYGKYVITKDCDEFEAGNYKTIKTGEKK